MTTTTAKTEAWSKCSKQKSKLCVSYWHRDVRPSPSWDLDLHVLAPTGLNHCLFTVDKCNRRYTLPHRRVTLTVTLTVTFPKVSLQNGTRVGISGIWFILAHSIQRHQSSRKGVWPCPFPCYFLRSLKFQSPTRVGIKYVAALGYMYFYIYRKYLFFQIHSTVNQSETVTECVIL